jgi:transcriptional regulator with XRE-family HTH domain
MKTTARELFAKRVRELRDERGWSQDDLAKATGLSTAYIGTIERAEQSIAIDNMEKIADAFKVPIFELLQSSSDRRVTH